VLREFCRSGSFHETVPARERWLRCNKTAGLPQVRHGDAACSHRAPRSRARNAHPRMCAVRALGKFGSQIQLAASVRYLTKLSGLPPNPSRLHRYAVPALPVTCGDGLADKPIPAVPISVQAGRNCRRSRPGGRAFELYRYRSAHRRCRNVGKPALAGRHQKTCTGGSPKALQFAPNTVPVGMR
jgi:hypothetical protein